MKLTSNAKNCSSLNDHSRLSTHTVLCYKSNLKEEMHEIVFITGFVLFHFAHFNKYLQHIWGVALWVTSPLIRVYFFLQNTLFLALDLKDFHITHTAQKSLSSQNHRPPSCPPRRALTVKQQTPITPSFSSPFPLACVVWLLRPLRFSSDPGSIQHRQGCMGWWKVGGHFDEGDVPGWGNAISSVSCQLPARKQTQSAVIMPAPSCHTWSPNSSHSPMAISDLCKNHLTVDGNLSSTLLTDCVCTHTQTYTSTYKCCVQNIKPAHIVEFPPDSSFQQQ